MSDVGAAAPRVLPVERLALPGAHNLENALAAAGRRRVPRARRRRRSSTALTALRGPAAPHRARRRVARRPVGRRLEGHERGRHGEVPRGVRRRDRRPDPRRPRQARRLRGARAARRAAREGRAHDRRGRGDDRARPVGGAPRSSAAERWRRRSRGRPSWRGRATRCCSRRPARPSTSTGTTRNGDGTSPGSPAPSRRTPMARKLASDKVLFVTLVALSLFGCVMIYSASAVSAGETSGNPYRYLIKQIAALALGGVAAFPCTASTIAAFAKPWVVYGAYGVSPGRRGLRAPAPADQRRAAVDPARRDDAAALRAPEGRRSFCCSRTSSRARPTRPAARRARARPGARLLARGGRHRRAAAGPGDGRLLRHALRGAPVARRRAGALVRVRRARDDSAARGAPALGRLPAGPHPVLPEAGGGPARRRVPGDPVADRRGRRRLVRQRPRRQPAEALLPAVPAHGLHLRDRRRGARLHRRRRPRDRASASSPGGACAPRAGPPMRSRASSPPARRR